MLHPVALAALALLLINDHLLKPKLHNALSGKLSDFAILVLGPLALHAALEQITGRVISPPSRAIELIVFFSGVVYALEKTVSAATELYRVTWGALRWPLDGLVGLLGCGSTPGYLPVAAVCDPSDLVALPALALPLMVHRARLRQRLSAPL